MKAKLPAERMLWEGNRGRPTYRSHLARNWVQPNASASWDDREEGYTYMNRLTSKDLYQRLFLDRPHGERSDLFDESSDAYIGLTQELDGVGGVATLVRAETHRFGAIFPSWLEDHEVETEGFGVLAKKAGARIVGLPNYLVMHKSESDRRTAERMGIHRRALLGAEGENSVTTRAFLSMRCRGTIPSADKSCLIPPSSIPLAAVLP